MLTALLFIGTLVVRYVFNYNISTVVTVQRSRTVTELRLNQRFELFNEQPL